MEDILHIHLADIDPSFQPIDRGYYTLQVAKAELKPFTYKTGDKAGSTGYRVALTFVVTDDPTFSGRKLYESVFMNLFGAKSLRRLMDAIGIAQELDQSLEEWLTTISEAKPYVKALVDVKEDLDREGNARATDAQGNPAKVNFVVFKELRTA